MKEYPSRRFEKKEVLAYLKYSKQSVHDSMGRETTRSLDGPSGFSWLSMTRAEVPLYNMRHVQHHLGQLGAYLRRAKISTRWTKRGDA